MNAKEFSINEYLDQIDIQITDPTLKQQEYFESVKHNLHHKKNNLLTSPFILRDVANRLMIQFHHKKHQQINFQCHNKIKINNNFQEQEL